jgi:hypothetical protein
MLFVHDNPKSGFYRAKAKDGTLSAVAIWYDSFTGELRYQENGRDIDEQRAHERWPFVSKTPITKEVFWQFMDTGVWGDIDETSQAIHSGQKHAGFSSENADPAKDIKAKIAEAKKAVTQYLKIESDQDATRAQSLRSLLTSLKGEVIKLHKKEKEPFLEEGRDCDRKWFPLRDAAEAGALQLRTAIEDWEFAKRKAAKAAEEAGVKPNMPAPAAKISGGMGRAANAKPYIAVVEIDVEKVFQQFKESTEVYEVLIGLAQQAISAGIAVPGAKTEEKVRVR